MGTQKKFNVVPFNVNHLHLMELRQEEIESVMALEDTQERFEFLGDHGLIAKTFTYNGRIIFSAGCIELWPGVLDCWMMPTIHVQTAKLEFCRTLRAYVNDIIDQFGCHRFQTTAPDDELHARWMRFLKMEKEGVMKKFTHNKKDYCMYARTV